MGFDQGNIAVSLEVTFQPSCVFFHIGIFLLQDISIGTESLIHDLVERSAATEEGVNPLLHRSMETDAWMSQLQAPECSRAVQTIFDDDDDEVGFQIKALL